MAAAEENAVPSPEQVKAAIRRAYPRNASVMIAWDAVWSLGMSCCLFATQVPAYLLVLGAPKWLMQTVMVGFSTMTVLQFFSGRMAHLPWRRFLVFGTWFAYGAAWFAYGLTGYVGWGRIGESVLLALFMCTAATLAVCNHLGIPVSLGVVLENTPLRRRGRLASVRSFVVGIFGLGGALGARWFMTRWEAPTNFHVAFMVGAGMYMFSCLPFLFVFRDNAQVNYRHEPRETSVRRAVAMLWSHFGFRVFLFFYALLMAGYSLAAMLIACGRDVLGMSDAKVAQFTLMWFVAAIVTGPLVPRLADRYGFRLIGVIGTALLVLTFALPLVLNVTPSVVLVAYGCFAASAQLSLLLLANLGTELVPEVNPAMMIAFGLTAVMPLSLTLAPLSGLLVDVYGNAAYLAVFVLGAVVAVLGLVGFIVVVREPRKGKLIYVRVRRG